MRSLWLPILLLLVAAAAAAPPKKPAGGKTAPAKSAPPAGALLIAEVVAFPKEAAVLRGGKPLPGVKKGTRLQQSDVLKTGKSGSLDLRLGPHALRLKPNSTVRLSTLLHA